MDSYLQTGRTTPTLTLVPRQDLPSRRNDIVENLQTQVSRSVSFSRARAGLVLEGRTFCLRILSVGEDLVDHEPCIGVFLELSRPLAPAKLLDSMVAVGSKT